MYMIQVALWMSSLKLWKKENLGKRKKKLGAVMYTFNASTQEWKQVRLYEFKSRLIYIK